MDAMQRTPIRAAILVALLLVVSFCRAQQITRAEYYIDSDPGFGMAEPVPVTNPGNLLSLDFHADGGDLTQGFHTIGFRARDNLGRWSHALHQIFYLVVLEEMSGIPVNRVEYFVDIDSGFGQAVTVPVAGSGNQLVLSFEVPAELRIADMKGRTLHRERINDRYSSVTADLRPGVYMLTITAGDQFFNKKLIIAR